MAQRIRELLIMCYISLKFSLLYFLYSRSANLNRYQKSL